MSEQRLYDIVMAHLRQQGKKAADDVSCLYRTKEGAKCAVGCLIPDDLYDVTMESTSPLHRSKVWKALPEWVRKLRPSFIMDVQRDLHDYIEAENFLQDLEVTAKEFAAHHKLVYKEPGL